MAKTSTGKKVFIVLSALLVVGLAGSTAYLFVENKELKSDLSMTDEERNAKDNEKIIAEVSKLTKLPEEEPVIILVNDPAKAIEDEPGLDKIFDDLQKDDILLVYQKDRSAVQYRQNENKIIKNSPISLPVKIELIGSKEATDAMEITLAEFGNQVTIAKQVNDNVKDPFVFAVNSKLSTEAVNVAGKIGYEVGSTLPASIIPSDQTEIVIVVTSATTDPVTP
jgi:hypothetical protein